MQALFDKMKAASVPAEEDLEKKCIFASNTLATNNQIDNRNSLIQIIQIRQHAKLIIFV